MKSYHIIFIATPNKKLIKLNIKDAALIESKCRQCYVPPEILLQETHKTHTNNTFLDLYLYFS